MADVFISYRRTERNRVVQLAKALEEASLTVWYDARLEVGQGQGFDSEIEREVTSAAAVLVCWTPEALKSSYVRAEAKKGLERNVLVPVFLAPCVLTVPFNDLETADLGAWTGEPDHPAWSRVLKQIKHLKAMSDRKQRSHARYEALNETIFPGTLSLLITRMEKETTPIQSYRADMLTVLDWMRQIFHNEFHDALNWYLELETGLSRSAEGATHEEYERYGALAGDLQRIRDAIDNLKSAVTAARS